MTTNQSSTTRSETPTLGFTVVERLGPGQRDAVRRLADVYARAGAELYLVGGIVRDVLLQRPVPNDLDFATSARPEQTKALVKSMPHVGLYDIGEKFGTIGLILPGPDAGDEPVTIEITTFRTEQYETGSRHPTVVYGTSIEDDLARRDTTINAIAVDVHTGRLIDPFFGQADLAAGLLRAVGDPDERFAEDPLRLLRIARFVSQLGFAVESETKAAMARQAPTLAQISKERILAELTKLLCGEYADAGLETLLETGLFTIAMPELAPLERSAWNHPGVHREKDLWDHTKRVVIQSPQRPVVRWAALLHDAAKPLTRSVDSHGEVHFFGHERVGADLASKLLRRLNADKQTQSQVRRLVDLHLRPASYDTVTWTDSAVRRLALEAEDVLEDLLDLAAADVTSERAAKRRAAATRVQGLRDHIARLEEEQALDQLQSPLDGNELMQMFDRKPGKWIAEVKNHLRELVIDGELSSDDKETATRIARDLLAAEPAP
ncbi:MAG TPA: HD domain-containing protein [Thermomicrobiales bacterium]|nr:HD domain-containing protein [Thermomicrobiales bacterium]